MNDFDLAALSEALDARRCELGLTWQELAGIGFPRVMRIFQWLGCPVAEFTCLVPDDDE
jgi:hypothetical protein